MRITLVGSTYMHQMEATISAEQETGKSWRPFTEPEDEFDADGPEQDSGLLSEFAGRACYESFDAPNPATQMNADYLAHIIEVGHGSVLEHGSASFYITGISRSLTHELIRHRAGFSYSQVSQRYTRVRRVGEYVVPPMFRDDIDANHTLQQAWEYAVSTYDWLNERALKIIDEKLINLAAQGVPEEQLVLERTKMRKQAREAARAVLPNMTPTAIVVTGNHRAWRHFLDMRGTVHADAEIRELAILVWGQLHQIEPNLYADYKLINEGSTDPRFPAVLERGQG